MAGKWKISLIGLVVTSVLSGCTTIQTRQFGVADATQGSRPRQGSYPRQGQVYHLPRANMKLRIVESAGVINVVLSGPTMVADAGARIISQPQRSAIADNNVTITVDPATNLLSRVESTSTGRIAQIAANAVRSVSFLQAASENQGVTLFDRDFSLDKIDAVEREADLVLFAYYQRTCSADARSRPDEGNVRKNICAGLDSVGLAQARATGANFIDIVVPGNPVLAPLPNTVNYRDCRVGICYRPFMPIQIVLRVGNVYREERTILVPDPNSLAYVNLASGVFAQQQYILAFSGGVLTSYQQNSQSELVGLARLPGDIVGGLISGPTEALGLRQTGLTAQTNYLNAVTANLTAQQAAATACQANPGACLPAAYDVMRVQLGRPTDAGPAGDSGGGVQSDAGGG